MEIKGDLEDQLALLEKEIDARKAEVSDLVRVRVRVRLGLGLGLEP